ncbi:DUF4245 family protein [Ruicaihuangia caeni]|uniref:DUF4245 family protein n=1 Tax=Ruicaihuangia caeni TaxID=3042517 RepID=A0AAW6TAY0_9MICO|nr:DUF4245 family protein [Klugiella sp. YN-L-19]MDI2099493.1 DUF4245 family protein [Klugiella sp. YN-L-19]
MSAKQRPQQPNIVAELGRPETPEETAARKAERSRLHRAAQTPRNLIAATLASFGIVLVLVLVVARPNVAHHPSVDYQAVAAAASPAVEALPDAPPALVVPETPPGWSANRAELVQGSNRDARIWYLGLITADDDYIAVQQTIGEDETWLAATIGKTLATGTERIAGLEWTVIDRRGQRDTGNFEYVMWTETDSGPLVLNGTASDGEFKAIAEQAGRQLSG